MKRLRVVILALAGLAALLVGCGSGDEEASVMAVAFRLDEGSPVLVAYAGDPEQEPFEPPAGRYYIEAVDQDDVVLSLGEVEVEDGGAVELPLSLKEAGGVAESGQADRPARRTAPECRAGRTPSLTAPPYAGTSGRRWTCASAVTSERLNRSSPWR